MRNATNNRNAKMGHFDPGKIRKISILLQSDTKNPLLKRYWGDSSYLKILNFPHNMRGNILKNLTMVHPQTRPLWRTQSVGATRRHNLIAFLKEKISHGAPVSLRAFRKVNTSFQLL